MSAAATPSTGARPANADVYDTVVPDCAAYRRWWLALAGGLAERRLRHALRTAPRHPCPRHRRRASRP